MEFTDEQMEVINKKIADAVNEATSGLYTQSDVDKRVDSAIKTRVSNILADEKVKWEKEQKMTAEELAQAKIDEAELELNNRLKEIETRENQLVLEVNKSKGIEILQESGIPKEIYETIIDNMISPDMDETLSKINDFSNAFTGVKSTMEDEIKKNLGAVPPPSGNPSGSNSKKIEEMSYSELMKLKADGSDTLKGILG